MVVVMVVDGGLVVIVIMVSIADRWTLLLIVIHIKIMAMIATVAVVAIVAGMV